MVVIRLSRKLGTLISFVGRRVSVCLCRRPTFASIARRRCGPLVTLCSSLLVVVLIILKLTIMLCLMYITVVSVRLVLNLVTAVVRLRAARALLPRISRALLGLMLFSRPRVFVAFSGLGLWAQEMLRLNWCLLLTIVLIRRFRQLRSTAVRLTFVLAIFRSSSLRTARRFKGNRGPGSI